MIKSNFQKLKGIGQVQFKFFFKEFFHLYIFRQRIYIQHLQYSFLQYFNFSERNNLEINHSHRLTSNPKINYSTNKIHNVNVNIIQINATSYNYLQNIFRKLGRKTFFSVSLIFTNICLIQKKQHTLVYFLFIFLNTLFSNFIKYSILGWVKSTLYSCDDIFTIKIMYWRYLIYYSISQRLLNCTSSLFVCWILVSRLLVRNCYLHFLNS